MRQFLMRKIAPALAAAAMLAAVGCGGGDPEERTFELEIKEGILAQGESMLEVKQDDLVTILATSDGPVSFHLHGYDIEKTAEPGEPATLVFTATATGSFPFTIHLGAEEHEEEGEHEEEQEESEEEGEDIELGRLAVQPR